MHVVHDESIGYVYFVTDGEAIKIGWTKHMVQRLSALQHPLRQELTVLGTMAAERHQETLMHHRFHHLRIRGEWFKMDPSITDYIKLYRSRNMVIDMAQHRVMHRDRRNKETLPAGPMVSMPRSLTNGQSAA